MHRLAPKPFIAVLFSVAFAGWITGNALFGFPGLSSEYLEKYKHEHEHYLEVVKSDDYKRYIQRPHLFDMAKAHDKHFAENLAFVEEYEHNPELAAEEHRLEKRSYFFDFFNASLVILLFARFGWRPLIAFIDRSIAEKVERMHAAKAGRLRAAEAMIEARAKLSDIPEAEAKASADADAAMRRVMEEMQARQSARLEEVQRELAEQETGAVQAAERRLRRELFDKAARELEEELRANPPEHARDALVERFTAALEGKRA